jgi:NADPH-dependent ferric siderophore reductase
VALARHGKGRSVTASWRSFAVEVRAARRLSPSFVRVTFAGDDLDLFADNGYDQRIKLAFPPPDGNPAWLPDGEDWYAQWRALPERRRSPIRTYTVRAVRQHLCEVDVDLVLHGDGGPATRWARRVSAGNKLLVIGPNARYDGDHGGVEFHPPAGTPLLLAGDETAAPAICAILERLPADARGHALLEVPSDLDVLPAVAPLGVTVSWLVRGDGAHGSALVPAVRALPRFAGSSVVDLLDDVDDDILWEVPTDSATASPVYAWLAGEAGVIRTLRRHLLAERGLDRRAVAFMGYWRLGRADDA